MLVTFLMSYIPMSGIILAFKNYRYDMGIFGSPWAANFGFDNFRFFFISGSGFRVSVNTILYNLLNTAVSQVLSITVALLLCEMKKKWFKRVSQSVIFLPYFISWTIVGAFVYNMFDSRKGWFNHMLTALGGEPVDMYLIPWVWVIVICFFNAWKWVGYGSVIYIAAIMGIDVECYEAANLDGASVTQKIRYITLPGIKNTIVIILLLNLGRILRGDFQMFYQIIGNNGQLFRMTDVIDTFVFRSLINSADLSMTAAAAFYQSFFCFIIIVTVNSLIKRFEPDYALF
ncbi:MAG: ABC transporter permease subunit [Clostridiales bacterium]|nr:ABC transporter permease subunit [Clostridiales bacterium]